MKFLKIFFNSSSKYDDDIPYVYEARYCIIDGLADSNSYFSDTICGLINHLKFVGLSPKVIELYEIYKDKETRIPPCMYTGDSGNWLIGNQLCQSFKSIYPDHIGNGSCKFSDRSKAVFG